MGHQTLTILFTDMKGFTDRTSGQSREATLEMVRRHRDLLLPVITLHGGNLVKSIGDAFLATFQSPTDAVLSGVALQETLERHNAEAAPEERIEIRVAINTGEVILEDGDVYGDAVNIAARLQALAEPNEVYFTESTYLSMNRTEVPSTEMGARVLKGVPEPIRIHRVLREPSTSRLPRRPRHEVGRFAERLPMERAPWRRRLPAAVLDLALVLLAVGLLLADDQARLDRVDGEVGLLEDRARILLAHQPSERVEALLGGEKAPSSLEPSARAALEELRQKRDEAELLRGNLEGAELLLTALLLALYKGVATAWKGRTAGQALLGLRVVSRRGEPLPVGRALLRGLLVPPSALPFGLGLLWGFLDAKRRTWPDLATGARVVAVPRGR